MLHLINTKRNNNDIFRLLSRKEQLKELKEVIGSKNKIIKDSLTFLLHKNITYDNTINIANIRGINTLIIKKVTVKSKIELVTASTENSYNQALALKLKEIRANEKLRLDKVQEQLLKDSQELKELKLKK